MTKILMIGLLSMIIMLECIHSVKVCTKYWVRKEWRELTPEEVSSFFTAIKCLKSKPSKYDPSLGSTSIYDDMVYIHIFSNDLSHKTAAFLPWHRQFLSIFENLLRNECNYAGSLPYWDFAMDSQAPERSPVLGKYAFGGNGGPNNGCVTDGAFVDWKVTFPQKKPCITRQYNMNSQYGNLMGAQYSPLQIEYMLRYYKNFYDFGKVIEEHPHNMAHYGIGGTMFDPKTSTNDPIFWVIHANVDRMWYTWQKRYPEVANTYGGNTRPNSTVLDASPEDMLRFYGLGDDVKVKDTFSTESLRYCYVYSNSIMPIQTGGVAKRSLNFVSKSFKPSHIVESFGKKADSISESIKSKIDTFKGNSISPGPFDRSDPIKLRYAIQIPDSLLNRKYPPEVVQQIKAREKMFTELVDEANRNNFVSPAALANFGSWIPASVSDLVKLEVKMGPILNLFSKIKNRLNQVGVL